MRIEHLPWESVPGPIYSASDLKPRKKWVAVGGWFLSALLVLGGIITPYRVLVLFGVLYVLALIMKKDTVITARGLEVYYQMQVTTQHDFWGWDEIGSVVREDQDHPELVALYLSRGDRVKRLFYPKADAEKIMALAKERNPKIVVGDADQVQMVGYRKKKK